MNTLTMVQNDPKDTRDEIVIMLFNDGYYLVKGDEYIDDILLGRQLENVSIDLIEVDSWQNVIAAMGDQTSHTPWILQKEKVDAIFDKERNH